MIIAEVILLNEWVQ